MNFMTVSGVSLLFNCKKRGDPDVGLAGGSVSGVGT